MTRNDAQEALMKVMVFPRDQNQYQRLLYDAMARYGVRVSHLGELTGSHTANLLLLPMEVAAHRLAGYRVLHLHWVFPFAFPGRTRHRSVGLASQAVFRLFLWSLRASGTRLVWTTHNVMPHSPVFWDDLRAREWLVRQADLVIAHNQSSLDRLADLGLEPARSTVIPHGPFPHATPEEDVTDVVGAPTHEHERLLVFLGMVEPYKGVDDLLDAYLKVSPDNTRLAVAGECRDPELRQRLQSAATAAGIQVHLCLRRLTEAELSGALAQADALVLPFRRITTSGSAILGLGAGVPLIIPDLPDLADLPTEAVFRYAPGTGLPEALAWVASVSQERLLEMGVAGKRFIQSQSWDSVAQRTVTAMRALFEPASLPRRPASCRPSTKNARVARGDADRFRQR